MSYIIRDAVPSDLPAIRDIYNDAVLNTLAIWNEQTVDLENRQQIMASATADHREAMQAFLERRDPVYENK